MTDCSSAGTTQLLLDGELVGEEIDAARLHLLTCSICSQRVEEAQNLSQIIRQAGVMYVAPASLRDRIAKITSEASLGKQASETYGQVSSAPSDHKSASSVWARKSMTLIAAGLLIVIAASFFLHLRSRSRADSFIDAAMLADRSLSTRTVPLDVLSNSPEEVTAWFSDKVPFDFRLPDAGIAAEGAAKYKMVGGRLIDFKGEHVAVIAFSLSGENISLLIASGRIASAVGGSVFNSNGLTFHKRQEGGRNIVTWENRGLTYALIFSASPSGQRACSACHEDSSASSHPFVDSPYLSQLDSTAF